MIWGGGDSPIIDLSFYELSENQNSKSKSEDLNQ